MMCFTLFLSMVFTASRNFFSRLSFFCCSAFRSCSWYFSNQFTQALLMSGSTCIVAAFSPWTFKADFVIAKLLYVLGFKDDIAAFRMSSIGLKDPSTKGPVNNDNNALIRPSRIGNFVSPLPPFKLKIIDHQSMSIRGATFILYCPLRWVMSSSM